MTGTRSETWVLLIEIACLITASIGMGQVWAPLKLMSFLGWEMGVFLCCLASFLCALVGIYSTSHSCCDKGEGDYQGSSVCFRRFGVMSFYHCFALLFLILHTFIAQPYSWYEMEKHWDIVSWRFPEFQHLNETDAVIQAGQYYRDTITSLGVKSIILLVLTAGAVVCTIKSVSKIVIVSFSLQITSFLAAIIGLVLVGIGSVEFRRQDFYGLQAYVPLQMFVNSFLWLGVAVIGGCARRWFASDRKGWCVYFWWLIVTLAGACACMALCISYVNHEYEMIDGTSDKEIRQANMNAGFSVQKWSRKDYKMVLTSHFSPVLVVLIFLMCSSICFILSGCYTFQQRDRIPKSIQ